MGQVTVMWFLLVWVGSLFLIMSLMQVFIKSGTYQSKLISLDVLTYSIRLSVFNPVSSTTGFNAGFCGSRFGVGVGSLAAGVGLFSGTGSCSGLLCWASIIDLVWTPSWLSAMMRSLVGVCCMGITADNFFYFLSPFYFCCTIFFVLLGIFPLWVLVRKYVCCVLLLK